MNLAEARAFVAALKPGDTLTLSDEPFEVLTKDCGVVEFCRPAHKDIAGAYHRASIENLVIALSAKVTP